MPTAILVSITIITNRSSQIRVSVHGSTPVINMNLFKETIWLIHSILSKPSEV